MKIRSLSAQLLSGLVLAAATLGTGACHTPLYYHPEYNYGGRPTPPSGFLERVLVSYTEGGSTGGLEILDALNDLRRNIQNTIPAYFITGVSANYPSHIFNFPEQTSGYVFSSTDGSMAHVNYSTESGAGTAGSFGANAPSTAIDPNATIVAGATTGGTMLMYTGGSSYIFSLPNVNKVYVNQGASIVLAMVRNSNALYRVVQIPTNTAPANLPPGYVDCQPLINPAYCVVPVGNTSSAGVAGVAYDHPQNAYESLNGNQIYIENCGPECGGTTASVTVLNASALYINNIPTVNPLGAGAPSPLATLPVANPIAVPGGVTVAVSDSNYLYMAGQSLQGGVFGGNLSLLNLSTYTVGTPIPISDGTHTRALLADDNTLWLGSTQCATGVRAATAAKELATQGYTDQNGNYNCLTVATIGTATPTVQIVPKVVQSNVSTVQAVTVGFPNTDQNQYYYGSLDGICWVQNYHKVYTGYGGQVHAFYTGGTVNDNTAAKGTKPPLGTEIDNTNITVQGTVLDVAYMDAMTNAAN